MNAIDLLAIIPFFITIVINEMEDSKIIGKAGKMIRLVRVLRVMRIFKLARSAVLRIQMRTAFKTCLPRHSTGLQSIAFTLKNSYKELGLLMLFLAMGVLIFSSLCYFAEKDEEVSQLLSSPGSKRLVSKTPIGLTLWQNPSDQLVRVYLIPVSQLSHLDAAFLLP